MFATTLFWVILICRHNKNIEYWRISLKLNHRVSFYIFLCLSLFSVFCELLSFQCPWTGERKKELCRLKNPPWTIMPTSVNEKHVHIFNAKLYKLHSHTIHYEHLKNNKRAHIHWTYSIIQSTIWSRRNHHEVKFDV